MLTHRWKKQTDQQSLAPSRAGIGARAARADPRSAGSMALAEAGDAGLESYEDWQRLGEGSYYSRRELYPIDWGARGVNLAFMRCVVARGEAGRGKHGGGASSSRQARVPVLRLCSMRQRLLSPGARTGCTLGRPGGRWRCSATTARWCSMWGRSPSLTFRWGLGFCSALYSTLQRRGLLQLPPVPGELHLAQSAWPALQGCLERVVLCKGFELPHLLYCTTWAG